MAAFLLFLALLFGGFGLFGLVGKLYVRSGGQVGEGGTVFTLAWPLFIRWVWPLIAIGVACLIGFAVLSLAK